jgi:hypothetical protein
MRFTKDWRKKNGAGHGQEKGRKKIIRKRRRRNLE